jgi:hypothetical protein
MDVALPSLENSQDYLSALLGSSLFMKTKTSHIYIYKRGGMKQAYTSMTCPKFIGYIYTI